MNNGIEFFYAGGGTGGKSLRRVQSADERSGNRLDGAGDGATGACGKSLLLGLQRSSKWAGSGRD